MPHDHSHDHDDHTHTPTVSGGNEGRVLIAFWLIFGFMLVEVAGGVISGSLALLADAGHMLTDAVALALAWVAFRLGRWPADSKRSFGYARFEVLAGFVNAITLFAIVIWIVAEAVSRLNAPPQIMSTPMLIVAVLGLLVNIFVFWWLSQGDKDHVNIKGALLHVLGDMLGSVGAIVAAIGIWAFGWLWLDPVLSVLVALLILKSAWGLLRETGHILLQGAPQDAQALAQTLRERVPELAKVGHIHLWSITSGKVVASLTIKPKDMTQAPEAQAAVEAALHDLGIAHATVAIDWGHAPPCPLQSHQH